MQEERTMTTDRAQFVEEEYDVWNKYILWW